MWAEDRYVRPYSGSRNRGVMGLSDNSVVVLYAGTLGGAQGLRH